MNLKVGTQRLKPPMGPNVEFKGCVPKLGTKVRSGGRGLGLKVGSQKCVPKIGLKMGLTFIYYNSLLIVAASKS